MNGIAKCIIAVKRFHRKICLRVLISEVGCLLWRKEEGGRRREEGGGRKERRRENGAEVMGLLYAAFDSEYT
jgi:hypothetical protein